MNNTKHEAIYSKQIRNKKSETGNSLEFSISDLRFQTEGATGAMK